MTRKRRKAGAFLMAILLSALSLSGAPQEKATGYAMPGFSPLYDPPPVRFRGNRVLVVVFKTDPNALRRLVPKPLLPNPLGLAFVYIGRLGIASGGNSRFEYFESGIGIPSFFGQAPGNYAVCLYLDKAMPIIAGREVWGWPKKEAEITFSEKKGKIVARVARNGTILLDLNARLEKKFDSIPGQPELPWFLLKIIPSVKQDAPPDVCQLVSVQNSGVKTSEIWNCTAVLKLGTSARDNLGFIPVAEIVSAQFSVGDLDLGYGDVLHDFLKK